tara:strand:- start:389 stop:739 length:351 start_codon:yes stop_codon:yes gene_type:complete
MTKLYQEIKDLNQEDALHKLCHVSYEDLKREYKELVDFKVPMNITLDTPKNEGTVKITGVATIDDGVVMVKVDNQPLQDSLPNAEFVDTKEKTRTCIIDGCDNPVTGRSKKCRDCR